MIASTVAKKLPFFYGWVIVGACFLCWLIADAFGFYTFGLFIGPIGEEFGWSTVMIAGVFTARSLVSGMLGPFIGHIADRGNGARWLMSGGVLAAAGSAFLVSRMQTPQQFYLYYGVFGALGMIGFGGLVSHTVIAKWFVRMRGRAMGVASMGVSVSGLIFIPLNHYLITHFGWRQALETCSILILGLAFIPTLLFIQTRPEDLGLLPDGIDPDRASHEHDDPADPDASDRLEISWTLKEALHTKSLWLMLIAFNATGLAFSGVMIHYYPYMQARGVQPDMATASMTTYAFFCAVVKLPWGLLAERFSVRYCIMIVYLGCALGLATLIYSRGTPFIFVYATIYGISIGGIMVVREVLFADYFGRQFIGTIRGVVMPLNLIAMAGGPVFAAWLYDTTGSYQLPYYIFLGAFIVGVIFMYLAKQPTRPSDAGSDAALRATD
ncbi:MAG: MFS transporter [Desulfobacterales bacterium]